MAEHFSVGVTLEVRLHRFGGCVNCGRGAGKILRYVRRGGESDDGVGVGVEVEVGSA